MEINCKGFLAGVLVWGNGHKAGYPQTEVPTRDSGLVPGVTKFQDWCLGSEDTEYVHQEGPALCYQKTHSLTSIGRPASEPMLVTHLRHHHLSGRRAKAQINFRPKAETGARE